MKISFTYFALKRITKVLRNDTQIAMLPRLIWWSMTKASRERSLSPCQGPN